MIEMRSATKEERDGIDKYIREISVPTGVNIGKEILEGKDETTSDQSRDESRSSWLNDCLSCKYSYHQEDDADTIWCGSPSGECVFVQREETLNEPDI